MGEHDPRRLRPEADREDVAELAWALKRNGPGRAIQAAVWAARDMLGPGGSMRRILTRRQHAVNAAATVAAGTAARMRGSPAIELPAA